MHIPGYAYSGTNPYIVRYFEIKDTPGVVVSLDIVPGMLRFRGSLCTDEAMKLSETDIAVFISGGSLAFGGFCTKYGNSFSGHINND